jgi:hypothetical protein
MGGIMGDSGDLEPGSYDWFYQCALESALHGRSQTYEDHFTQTTGIAIHWGKPEHCPDCRSTH